MPTLNGPEVRLRAAEMASTVADSNVEPGTRQADDHIRWLSQRTGIPIGTLHNVTRDHPQGISLSRVFTLAASLRRRGEKISDTVAAIVAEQGEDEPEKDPSDPVQDRPRDPSSPPSRPKRERTGPPRSDLKAAS